MDRADWLASLKPGDEVATAWNGGFARVGRRTPKRIVLDDGRTWDAETGGLVPWKKNRMRQRPRLEPADDAHRRGNLYRLRQAIGGHSTDCALSDIAARGWQPGDLCTVPHGGMRWGRIIARVILVRSSGDYGVELEAWSPSLKRFERGMLTRLANLQPVRPDDRRLAQIRKADGNK